MIVQYMEEVILFVYDGIQECLFRLMELRFWYHNPTYIPFSLCILGGRNTNLLLAGSSSFSLQATVSSFGTHVGAYNRFWYKIQVVGVLSVGTSCFFENRGGCYSFGIIQVSTLSDLLYGASILVYIIIFIMYTWRTKCKYIACRIFIIFITSSDSSFCYKCWSL